MGNNLTSGNKKFYKIDSLSKCFIQSTTVIDSKRVIFYSGQLKATSALTESGIYNVDENTIFFITTSANDTDKFIKISFVIDNTTVNRKEDSYVKINAGDTLLWVKGDFYAISKTSVINVLSDGNYLNITYSNGITNKISLLDITSGYKGIYPISIDSNANISLEDIVLDKDNKNYICFPEYNSIESGIKGASVIGIGNTGSSDNQFVLGQYSSGLSNAMMVIGGGTEEARKNLFAVLKDGNTYFENDAIAGKNQEYKLSEIHSVKPEDWAFINTTAITEETIELSDFE